MARVLKPEELKKFRGKPADYGKWADGQVWLLEEGTDYTNLNTVRTGAYKYAAAKQLKVRTRVVDEGMTIQFFTTADTPALVSLGNVLSGKRLPLERKPLKRIRRKAKKSA